MTFSYPLTWKCHVCGDVRPDAKISVWQKTEMFGGLPVQQNVRYCNDQQACIEGAKGVSFLHGSRT